MKKSEGVKITRDNFLTILGFKGPPDQLGSRKEIDRLYEVTSEFLKQEGASMRLELPRGAAGFSGLALLIPGTSWHVNLTKPLSEKIGDLFLAYLALRSVVGDDVQAITLTAIAGCMSKLSVLRKELGERCIAEAIQERLTRTTKEIHDALYDQVCRYPGSGCSFMQARRGKPEPICKFKTKEIAETLVALEKKDIVRKHTNVEPCEWQVVP